MGSFTKFPAIRPIDKKMKFFEIMDGFFYYIGSKDSGKLVRIKKGFITDFASTPKIFHSILPPMGKYAKAAVLHDDLYRNKAITVDDELKPISRKYADSLFLEAMGVLKISKWKKYSMYYAVRMFGKRAWDKYYDLTIV